MMLIAAAAVLLMSIRTRLDLRRSCLPRIAFFLLLSGLTTPLIARATGGVWFQGMAWLWLASDIVLLVLVLGLRRVRRSVSQLLPAHAVSAAPPAPLGCACGRSIEPGAAFCDACGQPVSPSWAQTGPTLPLRKGSTQ